MEKDVSQHSGGPSYGDDGGSWPSPTDPALDKRIAKLEQVIKVVDIEGTIRSAQRELFDELSEVWKECVKDFAFTLPQSFYPFVKKMQEAEKRLGC